jgi:hypothetical protein
MYLGRLDKAKKQLSELQGEWELWKQ